MNSPKGNPYQSPDLNNEDCPGNGKNGDALATHLTRQSLLDLVRRGILGEVSEADFKRALSSYEKSDDPVARCAHFYLAQCSNIVKGKIRRIRWREKEFLQRVLILLNTNFSIKENRKTFHWGLSNAVSLVFLVLVLAITFLSVEFAVPPLFLFIFLGSIYYGYLNFFTSEFHQFVPFETEADLKEAMKKPGWIRLETGEKQAGGAFERFLVRWVSMRGVEQVISWVGMFLFWPIILMAKSLPLEFRGPVAVCNEDREKKKEFFIEFVFCFL